MRYLGMPAGMWLLFRRSFEEGLVRVLGMDRRGAKETARVAKRRYRTLIQGVPEFEKEDRFKMNIVSCAMFTGFLLSLPEKPSVEKAAAYYHSAMMTPLMNGFCRMSAKSKFTEKDITGMEKTARLRAADRNPYSWNMEFLPYPDGSGYEARFTKCGICTLMREAGLYDLVPAMCRLDYAMSEAGGVSSFEREYTLASGGPYCDCGYRKKERKA